MSLKKEVNRTWSPAIRLAVVSMILCGLLFPLVVTGFGQVLFPNQANGSLAHLRTSSDNVGSYLIAQNFSGPTFFHPRNVSLSASRVDPDILSRMRVLRCTIEYRWQLAFQRVISTLLSN